MPPLAGVGASCSKHGLVVMCDVCDGSDVCDQGSC